MALSFTTVTWHYVYAQGASLVAPSGTVVELRYPVEVLHDDATPQTARPQPVQGRINDFGDLVGPGVDLSDAMATVGVSIVDPTDPAVSPYGYTLTVKVIPPDGRQPWEFVADLIENDSGYDLTINSTVQQSTGQLVTRLGPPGLSIVPDPLHPGLYVMTGTPLVMDEEGIYLIGA